MYKTSLSLALSSILSLNLLMTGCGNDEIEEQVEDTQVKQEETIDKERIETMTNVTCDLMYYESISNKMADAIETVETREDCISAYATVDATLEELRSYANCPETAELKGYLANMLVSTMEGLDYMYQNNEYSAEKALNDVQTYASKYQQEYKRLTNEYYSDNTEAYN